MNSKIVLILTITAVLLSFLFAGCGSSQAETAEDIVKLYHETHIYSEDDFFVCADMALDVWNMLKARGINAVFQIGNVETGAKDLTEVNHAWVLAETTPGKYLALETTGGYVVWGDDNDLYYQGWSFDNPREYKRYVQLKQEYNTRVSIIEQYSVAWELANDACLEKASELEQPLKELEGLSRFDPSYNDVLLELLELTGDVGKLVGRREQLTELAKGEGEELENITYEMKGLLQ